MSNDRLPTDEQDPWLKRARATAKEKEQCWICLKDYHEESECPTEQAHQRIDALREEHYKTHLTWDEIFEAWNHAIIPEAGWISISDAATEKAISYIRETEVTPMALENIVLAAKLKMCNDKLDKLNAL